MNEELKEAQQNYIISVNQIEYNLQEFEHRMSIEEKESVLSELQMLFTRLEENVLFILRSS